MARPRYVPVLARLLVWLVLAAACLLADGPTALAHAVLVQSDPASAVALPESPRRAQVWFNEPVEAEFNPLAVYNSRGERVDRGDAGFTGSDRRSVAVNLAAPLPPGFYTVVYRVVSTDGHPIQGAYGFTVGGAPAAGAAAETPSQPGVGTAAQTPGQPAAGEWPPLPVAAAQAVAVTAALAMAGLLAFALLMGTAGDPAATPGARASAHHALLTRLRRWLLAGCLALLAAGGVGLVSYLMRVAAVPLGQALDPGLLLRALGRTRFGHVWLLRLLLAALLFLAVAAGSRRPAARRWLWAGLLPAAGLLLSISLLSHAAATGGLALAADWLHLAAAAVWLGGLLAFALILPGVLRPLSGPERVATLARLVPRFSAVAVASLILLATTGTYAGLVHVPGGAGLTGTPYGGLLLAKLALVVPLVMLGAYHLLVSGPRFRRLAAQAGGGAAAVIQRQFRRLVAAEVLLMAAILVLVGWLTNVPPARVSLQLRAGPFVATAQHEDLHVTLRIEPARAGFNTAHVTLTDPAGQPVQAGSVELRVFMPDHDMGQQKPVAEQVAPGRYQVDEVVLGMGGTWSVQVVVVRSGRPEWRADFRVDVPDPL